MNRLNASRGVPDEGTGVDSEQAAVESAPRVAIVRDGSPEASDLEGRLTALGWAVSAAANCSELLAQAGRDLPGPVLLDLGSEPTPELVRIAKKLRRRCGATIVFLADDASDELVEASAAAGPCGYLLRPFSDGQLQLSLRAAQEAGKRLLRRSRRRKKQKRQVRRLKRRMAILDAVLELVPDPLFATDENGVRLASSASAAPFLGEYEPGGSLAQALNYSVFDVEADEPLDWGDLPLNRALRGERTDGLLVLARHSESGEGTYVNISARPLPLGRSGKTGSVLLVRDVTAERRVQADLQAALVEQEARAELMEAIFDSMRDGVIVADENGELLAWNSAAQRLGGAIARRWDSRKAVGAGGGSGLPGRYRPERWPSHFGIFLPDKETLLPKEESPLRGAIRGRTTENKRLFIRNAGRPEGGFVSVSARPLVRPPGEAQAGVLLIHDLTEEERIKAELEDTVERLRRQTTLVETVFNNLGAGVVAADAEGRFTTFNPAAEELVGREFFSMPPEEWTEYFGIFRPDGKTFVPTEELPLMRAMQGESLDDEEVLIRNASRPDGVPVSVQARPLPSEDGDPQGGVALFYDIGPRKEAENRLRETLEALRDQTELVEAAFEGISDGIVVADTECKLVYVNAAATKMIDLAAGDWIPMDDLEMALVWDGTPEVQYGCFDAERRSPLVTGDLPIVRAILGDCTDDWDVLIRNRLVPGGAIIRTNGRPLFNADGSLRGGVATLRDVTAERRADETLARAFAEGRLEMMDTILHNVGNAVSSVVVGAETIFDTLERDPLLKRLSALAEAVAAHKGDWANYVENDPQGRKVFPFLIDLARDLDSRDRHLCTAANRVRDRGTHIADIVRSQRNLGSVAAGRTDVDVARSVKATLRLLREQIDGKGISVDVDGLRALPPVREHASQFHQMLLNLLTNAIEAIEELATAGGGDEPPEIAIAARAEDDCLIVEVRDNGVGFVGDPQALIVAGYSTKESGSGLGLHSTANFVASSGGRLELSSEGRGRGATVRVILPLTPLPPENESVKNSSGKTMGSLP